jgi:isopenicillin-N epimerase
MDATPPTRRAFLRSMGVAGVLTPVATRLLDVEAAFADELGGLAARPWTTEGLADRYMIDPGVTYLNHASIGTMPRAVHDARVEYSAICESNPHLYVWGGAWDGMVEDVRAKAARFLGTSAEEVAITHNTTEGFNTLAYGLPLGPGDEVLFSSLNHGGASIPFEHAAKARGYTVRRFDLPIDDVPGLGVADVVELHRREIRPETRVLVFPHVDNIVGLRHPMAELAAMARAAGVEVVAVDGAQALGMIPVEAAAAGVDVYSTSPHKWLQSPKGLGLLYVRASLHERLSPMWVRYGVARWGGTSRMYEDYGTRNWPEVLSLGDAMAFQEALGSADKEARYRRLFTTMRERTRAAGLRWNSPERWEMGSVLVSVGFTSPANALSERLYRERGVVLRPFQGGGLNAFRVSPNVMNTDAELDVLFTELEQSG